MQNGGRDGGGGLFSPVDMGQAQEDDTPHLVLILEADGPKAGRNSPAFLRQRLDLTLLGLSSAAESAVGRGVQGGAGENDPAKVPYQEG